MIELAIQVLSDRREGLVMELGQVITANHYFLDAAGGVAIFLIGWFVSGWLTRAGRGKPVEATTQ